MLFGLSLLVLPSISLARTWTDDSGSHRVEAELSKLFDDEVELKTADGRLIVVPIAKLSVNDRQFIVSERIKRQAEREQAEKERLQAEHERSEQKGQAGRKKSEERRRQTSHTQPDKNSKNFGIIGLFVFVIILVLIGFFVFGLVKFLVWITSLSSKKEATRQQLVAQLFDNIETERLRLRKLIEEKFLVQPCSRCHEFSMRLLGISPNSRSVHYECTHCGKKAHAASGSPEASQATEMLNRVANAVDRYNGTTQLAVQIEPIEFLTAAAPLPYEQTERSPIPEAVRSEVWRRDKGCCVECGIKENLQFDHIIPVSRGGATSVQNLQLLCRTCNQRKGAKI